MPNEARVCHLASSHSPTLEQLAPLWLASCEEQGN